MEDKVQQPTELEDKQKTLKGTEIPVPKRSEIMDAFRRIIRPAKDGKG